MLSYRCNGTATSNPILLICFLTFLGLLFHAAACRSEEIIIGTGGRDSFSYFAGKSICQAVKSYKTNVSCTANPSDSAADNLTNLQNDSIELALVSSKTIYDAFHQSGYFKYINIEYNNLRLLMPVYKSPIALVARKDANICCLSDLEGKRINCGQSSTQEYQVFKQLMDVKKWQVSDFAMFQSLPTTLSQDSLALKRGSVQAMIHVGMHPDDTVQRLLVQDKNVLVPIQDDDIDRLIEEKVGFSRSKINAGTYPGLTEDLKTLALETLLIASATTDSTTIELVLAALHSSQQQLRHAHPSLLGQHTTVGTLNDSYLHPHPSALLFFQSTTTLY